MIKTVELTRDFGNSRGVFNVCLDVPEGCIYGFVGPNGAGKTTTIKILCGLLMPDSGEAYIGDCKVTPRNISSIKRLIGYMPDITGVYDQMSVWEFLDFYGAAFRIPPRQRVKRIEQVLELTNSSVMIDYQVASLSRGMRQRIGLAKTLMHDPAVLILDEPAGGLDPNARIEMRHTIEGLRSLGKTILLSSHILPELASVCDRVGIISSGRLLAQGTVKEISDSVSENLSFAVAVNSNLDFAMDAAKTIQGVNSVRKTDVNEFFINFNGSREAAGDILMTLASLGINVRSFKENEPDLENVFLNITHSSVTRN